MSTLTPEQNAVLEDFREAVKDLLQPDHDDRFLLRWLRAREFDPIKSEKMLRDSLQWRKRFEADEILEKFTPPEVLKKYYPIGHVGFDHEGCPVWICPYGKCDLKGILLSVKKTDFVKYVIYLLEDGMRLVKEQGRKSGNHIDSHTMIFDLEGFGLGHITWKPGIDMIRQLAALYEANYPEVLKKAYVINAPKVFEVGYAIIRPLLHEVTARKIVVLGKDKWKQVLLAEIDESELPEHWGGTKTDGSGDPKCPTLVTPGGDVPQSYYLAPAASRLGDSGNAVTLMVPKGSSATAEKEVTQPGSILKWEFKSEGYDVAFGVFRKTRDRMDEIVPKTKVNSHLVPEDGQLVCPTVGTYVLYFDNTYSMFRSKKVVYTLDVLAPDGGESSTSPSQQNNHLSDLL